MKNIYLGLTETSKKIELDFDAEKIKFILLVGGSASGKSIFHNNLYKELSSKYSSGEIGFVFMDMSVITFNDWAGDYLIKPVMMHKPDKAIEELENLANLQTDKKVFIHIEECDMVYYDRKRVEGALRKLKSLPNFYIVYSTSRIDKKYLSDWKKDLVDLSVVFRVPSKSDSEFLLGNNRAYNFEKVGERVLSFNNQQVICVPFTKQEADELENFCLK